jgi:hypothetical protein
MEGASIGVAPWRRRRAARWPWHGGARGRGSGAADLGDGGGKGRGQGLVGQLSLLGCLGPKGRMDVGLFHLGWLEKLVRLREVRSNIASRGLSRE